MAKIKKLPEGAVVDPFEELEKKYGLGTSIAKSTKSVSTGSYKLDIATGIGGHGIGKVIELIGEESSGKSTICLHAIAEFQKAFPNKKVALFDFEHSFDMDYAASIGVDVERLKFYQPDNQEQGYDLLIKLAEKGLLSLAIIDSHTAAAPRAVIEKGMTEATMAVQARINSTFLLKVKGILAKTGTTLIGVSQTRSNIGGQGGGAVSTGGKAWKFYSDVRYKMWKELDKEKGLNKTTVDITKNKCARPFGQAVIDIVWGEGFDNYSEVIDLCLEYGIMTLKGSWYSMNDTNIGQGKEAVKQLLIDNEELYTTLKDRALNFEPSEDVIELTPQNVENVQQA